MSQNTRYGSYGSEAKDKLPVNVISDSPSLDQACVRGLPVLFSVCVDRLIPGYLAGVVDLSIAISTLAQTHRAGGNAEFCESRLSGSGGGNGLAQRVKLHMMLCYLKL
jgi:hypothetical protein